VICSLNLVAPVLFLWRGLFVFLNIGNSESDLLRTSDGL
jgi:hypothetical protein